MIDRLIGLDSVAACMLMLAYQPISQSILRQWKQQKQNPVKST